MIGPRQSSFLRQFLPVMALLTYAGIAAAGAADRPPRAKLPSCVADLSTELSRFGGAERRAEFGAEWPAFETAARRIGWDEAAAARMGQVLIRALKYDSMLPAQHLRRLADALITAGELRLDWSGEEGRFAALITNAGQSDLTEYAFYNLSFALRLGLNLDHIQTLFALVKDKHSVFGAYTFNKLQRLFKTMREYRVDPSVAFRALETILRADEFSNEDLVALAETIERDVLALGLPADDFLRTIDGTDLGAQVAKRLKVRPPKTRAAFPLIQGPLRHSTHPYAIERTYVDGLRDLEELCLDETVESEGAFVFSPERGRWYSLGGVTRVDYRQGRVQHEIAKTDFTTFGARPKFVHVHPRSLQWVVAPPRGKLILSSFSPVVDALLAATPSRADLNWFLKLLHDQPEFEFEIVHARGVTRVHPATDLARAERAAPQFRDLRDQVLLDVNVLDFIGQPLPVQFDLLFADLNTRLDGAFRIESTAWINL